jgi:hypothetical protein
MKMYGVSKYNFTLFKGRYHTEVSYQFHALSTVLPHQETSVPIGRRLGRPHIQARHVF